MGYDQVHLELMEEENKPPDIAVPYLWHVSWRRRSNTLVTLKMSEVQACRTTQTIFGNQTEHTVYGKFSAMNKLGAQLCPDTLELNLGFCSTPFSAAFLEYRLVLNKCLTGLTMSQGSLTSRIATTPVYHE